jgi:hypothetical protein
VKGTGAARAAKQVVKSIAQQSLFKETIGPPFKGLINDGFHKKTMLQIKYTVKKSEWKEGSAKNVFLQKTLP